MKKSILIGALAALMLFAFVACDGSVGTDSVSMTVVSIATESVPEIVQGQKVSLSDYEVIATRYNGETFVVPAEDLEFATAPVAMTTASTDEDDAKDVSTIKYVGSYAGLYGEVETAAPVTALVYPIKAITVSGPDNAKYYQNLSTDNKKLGDKDASIVDQFKAADYTVTAIYEDFDEVEHSVVLAAEEYETNLQDTSDDTIGGVTVKFTPKNVSGFSQDAEYAGDNEKQILIVKDTITGWSAKATEYEYIKGANAPTGDYKYEATATWASGATSTVASTSITASWTSGVDSGKFMSNAATAVLTLTMDGSSQNINYTLTDPYVVSFKVSADGYSPEVGKAIDKTKITIAPSWKDNVTGTATFTEGKGFSLDTTTAPNVEGELPVVVTLDGQSKAPAQVLVLTAKAASAQPDESVDTEEK